MSVTRGSKEYRFLSCVFVRVRFVCVYGGWEKRLDYDFQPICVCFSVFNNLDQMIARVLLWGVGEKNPLVIDRLTQWSDN